MATPHIGAEPGAVAETVLMPGDPLRARFVAETHLADPVVFNDVRGMYGATGTYRGARVSVMGHGMGMPSIGIYSYELYRFFDVQRIIRIGSCGAIQPHVAPRDLVLAMTSSTDSNWHHQYGVAGHYAPTASWPLLLAAVRAAEARGLSPHVGGVLASDVFYHHDEQAWQRWAALGVLAIEMEAAALYANAAVLGREALVMLTVSDSLVTGHAMSALERQTTFTDMIEVALEVATG
jgi:purine-nucleoside phosphorylase